jgi:hypothetical protein
MSKQIRIYGCGGAGVNIVSHYTGRQSEPGCAEIMPALVDTSRSNLKNREIPQDATYLVDGLDGSGKIRAENHAEIQKTIKQILVQIQPTDFNLIVFSASGGSGSVIGPLLVKELSDRKIPVIAVVIGSDESVIAAENTLKTLQSLESIAQGTEMPVIMNYHQNNLNDKRSGVDRSIYSVIGCFSVLASGENLEMDYRDLVHWIQYTKVNNGRPQLATVHVATTKEQFDRVVAPISVASLYNDPDQEHLPTTADYQSVGYADLSSIDIDQLHFIIGINDLAKIGSEIKATVNQMMEARQARVEPDSLLDGTDGSTKKGDLLL